MKAAGPSKGGWDLKARLVLLMLAALSAGCQSTAAVKPAERSGETAEAEMQPVAVAPQDFATWRAGFRQEALAAGVSAATFDRAFMGVRPNEEVLANERAQPEFSRPIWDYLASAVSDTRIANGQEQLARHAAILGAVETRYGVPPRYLVAIWGLESAYGANTGGYGVIEALATLAYASGRGAFFREHLLDALLILEAGDIAPERMLGSWAGAMGQTQFMPAAFRRHAVDFDSDGRRDIWGSLSDVFASTANYLRAYSWNPRLDWGLEVRLPSTFPWELAELEVKRTVSQWQALGVQAADGGTLPPAAAEASILLPAGHRGPAFLVSDNFRTILRYNNATSYALAVGHLADRIAGRGPIKAAWPKDDPPLTRRADRIELQTLLTERGYDPGGIDGLIGPKTRVALRGFQREIGLPPDGYATVNLLARLRAAMAVS